MSSPATTHAGIFVQSRLPVLLHRVLPTGMLSIQAIAQLEAAILANLIYAYAIRESSAPLEMMEILAAGAVGAGLYQMAPP